MDEQFIQILFFYSNIQSRKINKTQKSVNNAAVRVEHITTEYCALTYNNRGVKLMPKDVAYGKTIRKSFAKSEEIKDMPNLLEVQKDSYKWFLETGLRKCSTMSRRSPITRGIWSSPLLITI